MSDPETRAEARRWLQFAGEDLCVAQTILKQETGAPRHACWLAQQAAEKAIKAALVFLQTDFPKSHDLDALRNLLPDEWRIKSDFPDLADLTEWAVEARYPGDWPDAMPADARKAVEQAGAILRSIADELGKRGL
jgi:HEPN domain-containing protein